MKSLFELNNDVKNIKYFKLFLLKEVKNVIKGTVFGGNSGKERVDGKNAPVEKAKCLKTEEHPNPKKKKKLIGLPLL